MSLTNKDVAGTYRGAGGGCCSPSCVTIAVYPACAGGICFLQSCFGCPNVCCFACNCGNNCWYHGSNNGMKWTDKDTLSMDCGTFTRESGKVSPGGAPPKNNEMAR